MANQTGSGGTAVDDEDEAGTRKGPWTVEEDMQLMCYTRLHGEGRWSFLAKAAGLKRTGRSCRLRWLNSLRPDLKRSKITPEEERLIIELHGSWGNRWSHIARRLPGRTDNEIKNYCRTKLKGKVNLQVESGGRGVVHNGVHFERSMGSYCLQTSSQRPLDHNSAEPSASFPTQSTKEVAVQINKTLYLQEDISPQVIPIHELNDEYVLQGETRHVPFQRNDHGQPGAASDQDLEGSEDQVFENSLLYNFSVGSPASPLYSSDFFRADGATHGCRITASSTYMVTSPEAFSDSEAYLSRYSDVLWNMGEVDDHFNGSKQSASRNDKRSY